jgi:hypothetical protein
LAVDVGASIAEAQERGAEQPGQLALLSGREGRQDLAFRGQVGVDPAR